MDNPLKSLFLAAVGGTTLTYEKAQEAVESMIEKGKVSVNEGKELSEDLKRTFSRKSEAASNNEENQNGLSEELLALRQEVNQLKQEVGELRLLASDSQEKK